jgi:flagellar biosynthesis/type III secretory pathway protein FliH
VKRELIRLAYEQGYEHEQILSLLRFIDWVIILPEDLEERLDDDIQEFEEGKKMPYVTSWERRAEKRGLERGEKRGTKRGRKEGRVDVVLLQLERQIGELEASLRELVEKLAVKRLDDLAVALLDFTEASDLERWLKRNNGKRRSVKVKK